MTNLLGKKQAVKVLEILMLSGDLTHDNVRSSQYYCLMIRLYTRQWRPDMRFIRSIDDNDKRDREHRVNSITYS